MRFVVDMTAIFEVEISLLLNDRINTSINCYTVSSRVIGTFEGKG